MKSPPSADLQSLTVRGVVTNILGFVYSFHANEFKRLKECIPSCIRSIRRAHVARTATKNSNQSATMNAIPDPTPTTPTRTEARDVDAAWEILHDTTKLKDQENAMMLKQFLEELGASESSDLDECKDQEIYKMANALKDIPKRKFLKALRKNQM